ncbi:MAG: LptF/LptG family permease, partial [Pseudomonadota bacterium]
MSILQRYFFKNVLASTLGVSGILCLILVGGRFVKYLSEAVDGRILGSIIGSYLFFRLPEFLQMILPLGFFIACILTLGRMYVQN